MRLTIYMCLISISAQYLMYLNDKNYAFHFLGANEESQKQDVLESEENPINMDIKVDADKIEKQF